MRPFRLLLSAFTAAALVVGASTPAAAAPPVGCYGFPDIPTAFLCVTEFTPGNAVPSVDPDGGSTVTIPRFCAGECYGPFTVPTPSVTPSNGAVLVLVYQGQAYRIGGGIEIPPPPPIPPIPPLPPLPPTPPLPSEACPGDEPVLVETDPYVCLHYGTDYSGDWVLYVGTCATGDCTVYRIPMGRIVQLLAELGEDPAVLVRPVCRLIQADCGK